jgi:hypothetical protein
MYSFIIDIRGNGSDISGRIPIGFLFVANVVLDYAINTSVFAKVDSKGSPHLYAIYYPLVAKS